MEQNSSRKRDKLLTHTITRMYCPTIILTARSQVEKGICCMIPFIKSQKHDNKSIVTEHISGCLAKVWGLCPDYGSFSDTSTLIKLYTLNRFNLFYTNYTRIKLIIKIKNVKIGTAKKKIAEGRSTGSIEYNVWQHYIVCQGTNRVETNTNHYRP